MATKKKAVEVTVPLRFFFCRFYRNMPHGYSLCWLSFAAFPIWIITFQKFRLEENCSRNPLSRNNLA